MPLVLSLLELAGCGGVGGGVGIAMVGGVLVFAIADGEKLRTTVEVAAGVVGAAATVR